MRPYAEGVTADGLAVEVVTGVLDHEADFVVSCEVHSELDVSDSSGFDEILWPTALTAV